MSVVWRPFCSKISCEDGRGGTQLNMGFLLAELGLIAEDGDGPRLSNSVLEEGFSSTELGVFIHELRGRLGAWSASTAG